MRACRIGTGRPLTVARTSGRGSGSGEGDGAAVGVTVMPAGTGSSAARRWQAPESAANTARKASAGRNVIADGVGYAKHQAEPILHVLDPHRVGPRRKPAGAGGRGRARDGPPPRPDGDEPDRGRSRR